MRSYFSPILEPLSPRGTVIARHYRQGNPMRVTWDESGMIQSLEEANREAAGDLWIAPGMVDLQINGYSGVDFQRDGAVSEATLLKLVRALRRDGCHRIFLTLTTSEWSDLLRRISSYRTFVQNHTELRRAIVGWHLEGPFLSGQPGFCGAHNPAWMINPSARHIQELREATAGDKVMLTLAPERANAAEAITEAIRCGFVVSLGHTNANASEIQAAIAAGARAFTHLANGCPQQLDRHDNILWNVIDAEHLTVGIIPDGIHVSPRLFRILHRSMSRDRIYWTTDAMSAAGAPPGTYTIGAIELVVGEDQIVRNPATDSFAGSALSPIDGIRRGAGMLGQRWQDIWDFFSVNPAKLVGLPSDLAPGSPAGFCLLRSK